MEEKKTSKSISDTITDIINELKGFIESQVSQVKESPVKSVIKIAIAVWFVQLLYKFLVADNSK